MSMGGNSVEIDWLIEEAAMVDWIFEATGRVWKKSANGTIAVVMQMDQ